jgi:hypothetical protein
MDDGLTARCGPAVGLPTAVTPEWLPGEGTQTGHDVLPVASARSHR